MAEDVARAGRAPRWKRTLRVALAAFLFLGVEALLPPSAQPTAWLSVGAIRLYQMTLSPVLKGMGAQCRYTPSCSHYGVMAIEKYGTVSGAFRTAGRIVRCAPWGPPPGEDLP